MIKRCLIAAFLLVLLTAVSSAQSLGLGLGIPKSVPSAGGYVGIGNLSLTGGPITWYYGGSCYKASYSGNVADVYSTANSQIMATLACNGSGSIVATTGNCPGTPNACWSLATVQSTCVTLTACRASTIYEQSGVSGNPGNMLPAVSNATATVLVYANGASTCGNGGGTYLKAGNFCFYGDGSAVEMYFGNATQTYAQPISIDVVSMPLATSNSSVFTGIGCSANDNSGLYYNSGFFTYAQTAYAALGGSLNNWYAVIGAALNGTSSSASLNNGAPVTTNVGTAGFTDCYLSIFYNNNLGGLFYNGYVAEWVAFGTTALNSTDVTNIFNNDVTRLGGGL